GLHAIGLEIAGGPPVGLVKKDRRGLVALGGQFIGDVAEIEMTKDAIELGHVDVGDPGVAPDEEHVLVILQQRAGREVRGAAAHQRVVRQWIDQQEFGVDKEYETVILRTIKFL